MIHWRFGGWHDAGLPARAGAEAWLCDAERERLRSFKVDKRREDWLIGRVTAKALVADIVDQRYGVRVPAPFIHIARQPSGAPWVEVLGGGAPPGRLPASLPLCLSNSHSADHALCGALWTDGFGGGGRVRSIGVDLEWIEPRSDGFVRDFLTRPEQAWVGEVEGSLRHVRANVAWSAKESVLKVVQRGLTVDTWWLTCVPASDVAPGWLPAMLRPADGRWEPLDVTCDGRFPTHGLRFKAVWREIAGFAATVAAGHVDEPAGDRQG